MLARRLVPLSRVGEPLWHADCLQKRKHDSGCVKAQAAVQCAARKKHERSGAVARGRNRSVAVAYTGPLVPVLLGGAPSAAGGTAAERDWGKHNPGERNMTAAEGQKAYLDAQGVEFGARALVARADQTHGHEGHAGKMRTAPELAHPDTQARRKAQDLPREVRSQRVAKEGPVGDRDCGAL